MQINIISIGKLNNNFSTLAIDYLKMTKWHVKNTEIVYSKKIPSNLIKQFEADLILKHLDNYSYKVALDRLGLNISSEELATIFEHQMMNGKDIDFIIGGAFGLGNRVLEAVDFKMSLSKMTMPHQLAKIVLLEQIYRCQTIIEKHPYHK